MDLKTDYAFKQLFGQPQTSDVLRGLLNALLRREGSEVIRQVRIVNSERTPSNPRGKTKRLDIYAQTDRQEHINIESQVGREPAMVARALLYWASLFDAQAMQGMVYQELTSTIAISFLNFRLFPSTDSYHTTYHIYRDHAQGHDRLTDLLELHFVELPKFRRRCRPGQVDVVGDPLVRWLLLLDAAKNTRNLAIVEGLAMSDRTLEHALRVWEEISHDPEQYAAFLSRRKAMLDEVSRLRSAETRGVERGHARGMREGEVKGKTEGKIEVARAMVASGDSVERVMRLTGLDAATLRGALLRDIP